MANGACEAPMQILKKLHQYIPGFRQLSPRSMAIALTYYAVAVAALFSRWYWGVLLLALPFLLFNVLDLNRGRGKLAPLFAACAAGLAVLCGTAGVLSAGGPPGAQPIAERTSAVRTATAKPSPKPSMSALAASAPAEPASASPSPSASGSPAPAGSSPAAVAAAAGPEVTLAGQGEYAYVASKSGKVFHRPDCASAKRIKPENLIGFFSREEAVAAGLQPCKRCKP